MSASDYVDFTRIMALCKLYYVLTYELHNLIMLKSVLFVLRWGSYDARVICEHGEQPELVADKVVACINRLNSAGSKFMSTRSSLSDNLRFEYLSFGLQFSSSVLFLFFCCLFVKQAHFLELLQVRPVATKLTFENCCDRTFFTEWIPFLSPNQRHQSTEGWMAYHAICNNVCWLLQCFYNRLTLQFLFQDHHGWTVRDRLKKLVVSSLSPLSVRYYCCYCCYYYYCY